jgi:exosome complex component CSL4
MDVQQQVQELVMPGDKVGVEEEFVPAANTYVDSDGSIRASIAGSVVASEGKISVINIKHDVRKYKRGMMVLGKVSDDLRSVMFIKLDVIKVNGIEYIPLKDGKIVTSSGRRGPPGRDFHREHAPREEKKRLASVGDVVLAKVIFEDPDVFTLGIDEPEAGVVYAECEMCSTHLEVDTTARGMLSCPACSHKEQRKISTLYGKTEQIRKLFV